MKTKKIILTMLWICLCLAIFVEAEEHGHGSKGKDLIILDEQGAKNLRLETVEAEEGDFEETVLALGRIEIFPGSLTVISSRIPGRTFSLLVKADMEVEEGAELMWVESRQPGNPPPTVALESPVSGTIVKVNTAAGKPVSPDDSLIEIVDLEQVHAVAKVPEHYAGKLKAGQKAFIKVSGYPDQRFEATLAHIGALADPVSGTLEAAFHVPNPDKLLRPGMLTQFSIVTSFREDVLSVPKTAVQGEGGNRFVYIADYDLKNAFEKAPVEIGEQNEDKVEIKNGIFAGDLVVSQGAYALSFAGKGSVSLKEAMDAAHGHAHAEDGSELSDEAKHEDHEGHEAHGEEGHRDSEWNAKTVFFAGLSALFFVLLLLSLVFRKRPTA